MPRPGKPQDAWFTSRASDSLRIITPGYSTRAADLGVALRDVVLVAVTQAAPVGVDVEVINGDRMDYAAVLPSVCGPGESAFVTDLADFLTCWTRKEAVLKATGHGLRLAMPDVVVSPPRRITRLESFPSPRKVECWLTDLDIGDGYAAAIAVLTPGPVEVEVIDASAALALA